MVGALSLDGKVEDDLSAVEIGFEILVRGAHFSRGIHTIDHRPDDPARDEWQDMTGKSACRAL